MHDMWRGSDSFGPRSLGELSSYSKWSRKIYEWKCSRGTTRSEIFLTAFSIPVQLGERIFLRAEQQIEMLNTIQQKRSLWNCYQCRVIVFYWSVTTRLQAASMLRKQSFWTHQNLSFVRSFVVMNLIKTFPSFVKLSTLRMLWKLKLKYFKAFQQHKNACNLLNCF